QGVGQALLEHGYYDPETAQLLAGSFMDYAMPRADDVPSFDCAFHNVPCTANPLGVKGAGEAGAVGSPPAVINAVVDALRSQTGLKHFDMPATRERCGGRCRDEGVAEQPLNIPFAAVRQAGCERGGPRRTDRQSALAWTIKASANREPRAPRPFEEDHH